MADTKSVNFNLYNDDIVCPYCGHELGDSWEYRDDEGRETCPSCEKDFVYSRNISVSYDTHRINEDGSIDYDDELIEAEQDADEDGET